MLTKKNRFRAGLVWAGLMFMVMQPVMATPKSNSNKAAGTMADSIAPPDRKDVFTQGLKELGLAEARINRHPDSLAPHLDRLRILFVLGVKEEKYLALGTEEIEILKRKFGKDAKGQNLLLGYAGAIQTVQAKHGFNLKRKWKNLESGLPILDTAVARDPEQAEIRYLRLVNNYYLPFFLGRKSLVKEDFFALARLLPVSSDQFPAKWFLNVAGFVAEKGKLTPDQYKVLKIKIEQVKEAARAQGILARSEG